VTAIAWSRIEELRPRLLTIGRHYAGDAAEDMAQEMLLLIAEHAASDPAFLEQRPAFICQWATWRTIDARRREFGRTRYNPPRLIALDDQVAAVEGDPPGDALCYADLVTALESLPAELCQIAEWLLANPEKAVRGRRISAAAVERGTGIGHRLMVHLLPATISRLRSACS